MVYLPWANFKEEFTVGPVSFWPFSEMAEEKIGDREIREEFSRFFEVFVDHLGKPVDTVVACSCGEITYRRFTDDELDAIDAAADYLTFAAIATGMKNSVCANNPSMGPPSADRFDTAYRWIYPLQDGGVGLWTENSRSTYPEGKYLITCPISLGGSFLADYKPLLDGLSLTFEPAFPDDVRERLRRSLEWFRPAHTESPVVSWQHKVSMIATAFEILLELKHNGKTEDFVDKVDSQLRIKDSVLVKRKYGKNRTKEKEVCKAAEWAAEFYHLRSRIVHGDKVTEKDFVYKDWITHGIVADLVLLELVKRMLYRHDCIDQEIRLRAERIAKKFGEDSPEAIDKVEKGLLSGLLGLQLDDVHEALGWRSSRLERKENRKKQNEE